MIIVLRKDEVLELFSTIISNPREKLHSIPLFEYFCNLGVSGHTIAMRLSDVFGPLKHNEIISSGYFTIDSYYQLVLFESISGFIKGVVDIHEQIKKHFVPPLFVTLAPRVLNVIMTALDTDEILDDLSRLKC